MNLLIPSPVRNKLPKATAVVPLAQRISNGVWKNKLLRPLIFAILGIANLVWAVEITNPIAPVSSFPQLIDRIASALRTIVMPLAIAAIIFVGFKFVSAAASGNQAELTKAKTMLWWVLIGTAIIIGASVLAQAVVNFASSLNS